MEKFSVEASGHALVTGPAYILSDTAEEEKAAGTAAEEKEKLCAAVEELRAELRERERTAGEDAAIWEVTRMVLEDETILHEAERAIDEMGSSAAMAVRFAGEKTAARLEALDSEYLRARSGDVRGVAVRLLQMLQKDAGELKVPSVIFARELSPGTLAMLDRSMVLALVTERGSASSHVSVLAGSWGVPYVFGGTADISRVTPGETVLVDEEHGEVILSPEEERLTAARESMELLRKRKEARESTVRTRTKILANIGSVEDIPALLESSAEGVGLFRSEFLFLGRDTAPSEEEQLRAYRKAVEAMGERETVIRTMDLGADKLPSYLPLPAEKNPALGLRGIRASLREPELFHCQLRALLRAAVFGNEKMLFPMITAPEEIDVLREHVDAVAQELEARGEKYRIPPLGAMIETPAAALLAEELAEKVSFFSIGTNDLTQYTLARDRETENTAPREEAVFRLVELTVQGARKKGIPVTVCGEMAAVETSAKRLVELGVDALSVSCSRVGPIRAAAASAEKTNAAVSAETEERIAAPADGELIPLEEIPDPAFASGSLGRGFGVMPESDEIFSPVTGTVESVTETGHAIILRTERGRQVLLHAGIDTVKLKGKGFCCMVKPGDAVSVGAPVLSMDLRTVKKAGFSPIIITILCKEA